MTEITTDSESKSEVFGRLYEEYMPGVYRFVFYRVGDRALSEDIVSDIFNKALTAFSRYDHQKASFSTWIYTIARNTLTDHFRKQARERRLKEEKDLEITSDDNSVDDKLSRKEEFEELHRCLLKLKTNEQEIISLKFSGGMTNRAIAEITGLSESNVGTILCRTIRKLRDEFSGQGINE